MRIPVVLLFLVSITLIACGDTVRMEHIHAGMSFCKEHGGLSHIETSHVAEVDIDLEDRYLFYCTNGKEVPWAYLKPK